MPAILPSRLKQQSATLAEAFAEPDLFLARYHDLLSQYADHTLKPGLAPAIQPLLKTFRPPQPLITQILLDIKPMVHRLPDAALTLCDRLWKQPFWEHRLLAAHILGRVAKLRPDAATNRRQAWLSDNPDIRLIDILIEEVVVQFDVSQGNTILDWAEIMLNTHQIPSKRLGLRLLKSLSDLPSFENLPAVYRLCAPYIKHVSPLLKSHVVDLLISLAHRSPQEVAFILKQNLEANDNPDTAWLIRQSIDAFPAHIQANLRYALRERNQHASK